MPWKQHFSDLAFWRTAIDWCGEWLAFPIFMQIHSRTRHEDDDDRSAGRVLMGLLPKALLTILFNVIGVVVGGWVLIQLALYRLDKLESAVATIQTRQFRNEDRIALTEKEVAIINERHRLEEIRSSIRGGAVGK